MMKSKLPDAVKYAESGMVIATYMMMWWSGTSAVLRQKARYFIPKSFQITLSALLLLLLIYNLLRLGFVIYNRAFFADIPPGHMLMAFVHGVRFDLSGLLMLNAVFFGLYNLPGYPTRNRLLGHVVFTLFCLVNLAGIYLTLIDYAYYPVIFRRTTYEPLVLPREILSMFSGMAGDYLMLLVLGLSAGAGFILASHMLFSFLKKRLAYEFHFFRDTIFLILLIGLMVVGIRGGLQSQPIRPSHAFFSSSDRSLGYVTLNTPFNIIISYNQKSPVEQMSLIDRNEARKTIQEMFYLPDERNLEVDYPFLRQPQPAGSPKQYNVVVLVMESWSASSIGALGAYPSATPFFDQLADKGLLFTNFISSGQRSVEALPAIVASLPHILNVPLIGSRSELNGFLGMGTIFLHHGYATSFHHGAKTGSMGFDAYSRLAGFEHYLGKEDVPDLARTDWDGVWGVYDHIFFIDTVKKLESFRKPFCSVIYGLSPHEPLALPANLKSRFGVGESAVSYEQALRYSDFSLRQFFEHAKTKSWFNRTVFIIVGDHPFDASRNDFHSTFHVPLLIYAPDIVKPYRDHSVASQVDILPTLLDLLRFQDAHASMGQSLLQPSGKRYAVVKYRGQYALLSDNLVFLSDLGHAEGLYNYRKDPGLTRNLTDVMPEDANRLKKQLLSYLQEVTTAVSQDRMCRKEDLKFSLR
ncbi:MAG: sulfatase-like hydrolase/transferase [Smithellaceae bacterium]|nr:sulfatase-like hydrolase/transferase [Smithellaceae bacterium]